jgi:hypothetical protein
MLMNALSSLPAPSVSPKQSVIDWVVDCFLLFKHVERKLFQRMIEAYSNKCAIQNADTLHDSIIAQSKAFLIALKEELEADSSTICLSFDG